MAGAKKWKPVETGAPRDDPAAFRRCLGQFATGVAVVTTRFGGKVAGLTSNSFSSVSLDPPLVLWSLKRTSQSFGIFCEASHFAVNILSADQVGVSQRFARSGEDKFDGVEWVEGHGGVPLLGGTLASFECRRTAGYDGGDHVVFMGEVERYCRYDSKGLIFAQGCYMRAGEELGPLPAAAGAERPADGGKEDRHIPKLAHPAE